MLVECRLFVYGLLAALVAGGAGYYLHVQRAKKDAAAAKAARQQLKKSAAPVAQEGYDESWIVRRPCQRSGCCVVHAC